MINPMNILRISTLAKALLALIFLSPLAVSAGVYKWTDASGNVHYGSERPADSQTERLNIDDGTQYNPYADPTEEEAKRQQAKKEKESTQEKAKLEKEKQAKAKATPPPVAEKPKIPRKEKQRRCQQARAALSSILSKGRLREIDEQGNYSYASEKQRQQRISLEKKDVSEYCK